MLIGVTTQKTIPPAPASRKKGIEAVAIAAYCWARVTSWPGNAKVKSFIFGQFNVVPAMAIFLVSFLMDAK